MSKRLPVPVQRVLREPFDDAAIDAASRRVRLAPRAGTRVVWPIVALAVAALVTLVAVVSHSISGPSAGPIRFASGSPFRTLPITGARSEHTLDDGSRVALAPGASIQLLANDGSELVLLARGAVTFDVQPGGPRRWTIECGLASVVVVGTRFTIEQAPGRLRVSVARGAVIVRGELVPERVRRLGAGEELLLVEATGGAPILARQVADSPARAAPEHTEAIPAPTPETVADRRSVPTRVGWRTLAATGAWDRAYAELGAEGIVREAPRAGVDVLFELADVARLSGHPNDAVAPLERIVLQHPSDPNAALAAFTLGRVESDQLRRPERAAHAFGQALALGLPTALRPDALARLARAHRAAAHTEDASRAASQYLAEYPNGPQSASMRALVGAPE